MKDLLEIQPTKILVVNPFGVAARSVNKVDAAEHSREIVEQMICEILYD